MDSGLIFVFGVAFGLLGGVGFVLLLIGSDDYATAYFRAYWSRLGDQREQVEAQGSNGKPKENVSQSTESQTVEPPRPVETRPGRGILALLLALLLSGCASVGGGVGYVQSRHVREGDSTRGEFAQQPTSPRTEELPVCGFEAPYLPDPCRLEVTPGEWLRISNPKPKETKKHGWLWWLLISLMTI